MYSWHAHQNKKKTLCLFDWEVWCSHPSYKITLSSQSGKQANLLFGREKWKEGTNRDTVLKGLLNLWQIFGIQRDMISAVTGNIEELPWGEHVLLHVCSSVCCVRWALISEKPRRRLAPVTVVNAAFEVLTELWNPTRPLKNTDLQEKTKWTERGEKIKPAKYLWMHEAVRWQQESAQELDPLGNNNTATVTLVHKLLLRFGPSQLRGH